MRTNAVPMQWLVLSVTCAMSSPCSWCAFVPGWTSDSFVCSPFSIPPNWKSSTARSPRRVPSRSKWWPHHLRELSSGLCQSTRKLNMSLKWSNAALTTSWAASSTRVRRAVLCWQPLSRAAWLRSGHEGCDSSFRAHLLETDLPVTPWAAFYFLCLAGRIMQCLSCPWEESTEINLVPARVGWMSVPVAGTVPLAAFLCSAFAPAMRSSCSCAQEWASMLLGQGSCNRMQYHLQSLIHASNTEGLFISGRVMSVPASTVGNVLLRVTLSVQY